MMVGFAGDGERERAGGRAKRARPGLNRSLLFLVLVAAVAGAVVLAEQRSAPGLQGTVERVVDGDTVEVALDNGTVWTVRLIGVDTPEVHVAVEPEEYGFPPVESVERCLRAVGRNASRFVAAVAGERAVLELDPAVGRRGDYGRLLAYVHVDGMVLNRVLVERGLGRVYASPFRYRAAFERLEAVAVQQEKGVWGCD